LEAVLNNELGSLKWRVFAGSGNLVSLDIVVFPRPHLVERQLLLTYLYFFVGEKNVQFTSISRQPLLWLYWFPDRRWVVFSQEREPLVQQVLIMYRALDGCVLINMA